MRARYFSVMEREDSRPEAKAPCNWSIVISSNSKLAGGASAARFSARAGCATSTAGHAAAAAVIKLARRKVRREFCLGAEEGENMEAPATEKCVRSLSRTRILRRGRQERNRLH